jgi:hypothetical protein
LSSSTTSGSEDWIIEKRWLNFDLLRGSTNFINCWFLKIGKNTLERDWYLLWAIPVYLLSEGNFGSSIFLSSFFKFGSSILFSAPATIDGVFEKPICIFGLKKFTEYEQLRHAHGGINA